MHSGMSGDILLSQVCLPVILRVVLAGDLGLGPSGRFSWLAPLGILGRVSVFALPFLLAGSLGFPGKGRQGSRRVARSGEEWRFLSRVQSERNIN